MICEVSEYDLSGSEVASGIVFDAKLARSQAAAAAEFTDRRRFPLQALASSCSKYKMAGSGGIPSNMCA